ncbi:MAG: Gluconolactonase [uncultured Sphingomonadaceae bacterium]|uniref:Gluconolactonase n=1 Tax=uncultured Sphingomonadaceae bacterium TaxID=169976 RepID=A0A6J4TZM8_9SPHN|nr:MAG: Gluconolactonase [uncultured Sphingomonadaceae bacterium]
MNRRDFLAGLAAGAALPALAASLRRIGEVRRLDPALDAIIDRNAPVEVLGEGYGWAEGPVWVGRGGFLLFTDVPGNRIWRWSPAAGVGLFMEPSGLAGPVPAGVNEAGANGLALDARGRLLMADSGSRAIARVDLATRAKTILADRVGGKRFNSPNDLVVARSGAIYFTDPPYGLKGIQASPLREMAMQGVYRLDPDGRVSVIDDGLSLPNGIALSPDGRTLYVSMSDKDRPEILAYALDRAGRATGSRVFHDMRPHMGRPGLPDGMDVAASGHLFATGPGGVHVLAPGGKLLGVVSTGKPIANCCLGENGRSLFMTSHDTLARVRLAQRRPPA